MMRYRLSVGNLCNDFYAADDEAAIKAGRKILMDNAKLLNNAPVYDCDPQKMEEVKGLFDA